MELGATGFRPPSPTARTVQPRTCKPLVRNLGRTTMGIGSMERFYVLGRDHDLVACAGNHPIVS